MIKEKRIAYDNMKEIEEWLEEKIIDYISERFYANKDEIEEVIKIVKSKVNFEDIMQVVEDIKLEKSKYKEKISWELTQNGFSFATLYMPIGYIGVETSDELETIRYFLRAIMTHNVIDIIDIEYRNEDLKHFLLMIMKSAISKFNLSEDMINIVPYEEAIDENYDRIIYKDEDKKSEKKISQKNYIYLADNYFEKEALNELERLKRNQKEAEIIRGDYDEVIKKINSESGIGAVIYTTNSKIGYDFINDVNLENVYVNVSLLNINEEEKEREELYILKSIAYPLTKKVEDKKPNSENEKLNKEDSNDKSLVKYSTSHTILQKIKEYFKTIFLR